MIGSLLHGLSGPIDGRTYAEVMPPMGANNDAWIADLASFVRQSFGNSASVVTPSEVARVRKRTAGRRTAWTVAELTAIVPRRLTPDPSWRATASHNSSTAAAAFDFARWSTGTPQARDMWFQIELPQAVRLTEIQFESEVIAGRGGAPPTATAPRGYRIEVSIDGKKWIGPVADGQGTGRTTTISFAPVKARFVRIVQTADEANAPHWSMERLRLYEGPGT